MHALQVAENLATQIEHHHLAGPLHEVGLQIFEQETEEDQSDVNCRNLSYANQRLGTQPFAKQRRRGMCGGQIAIHGDHGQSRPEHIGNGL